MEDTKRSRTHHTQPPLFLASPSNFNGKGARKIQVCKGRQNQEKGQKKKEGTHTQKSPPLSSASATITERAPGKMTFYAIVLA
jgi:hypothetical protein